MGVANGFNLWDCGHRSTSVEAWRAGGVLGNLRFKGCENTKGHERGGAGVSERAVAHAIVDKQIEEPLACLQHRRFTTHGGESNDARRDSPTLLKKDSTSAAEVVFRWVAVLGGLAKGDDDAVTARTRSRSRLRACKYALVVGASFAMQKSTKQWHTT